MEQTYDPAQSYTKTGTDTKTRTGVIHTVDAIVWHESKIVLIERLKTPKGIALPGGHLESGETLEEAVERETIEETGLRLLDFSQFRTYSDPNRDPRGRYISTVFVGNGYGKLRAGDDAKSVMLAKPEQIEGMKARFAFDHYKIITDYLRTIEGQLVNRAGGYAMQSRI